MVKRRISLLLAVMMILTIGTPLNAFGVSKDYTGHWAEGTIQSWLDKGYISGYPDGSFKPDGKVTRAEFVKMVNSIFNYTETSNISFSDVKSSDWYYQEVQKAFDAGYISGISKTQFAPNKDLTREQAAVIVSRIKSLEGNSAAAEVFSDSSKISSYAKDGVGAAAKANIIKGYEDNTFKPQDPIKRAEAIVILNRAISGEQSSDLTIDKAGTVVENITVENIRITNKVGKGEVTLKNVTVTGELLVEGGGENSIIIEDSSINEITTNKADGKVRILLKGSTSIDLTTILSGTILEQQSLTGTGFADVVVSINANASQTLTIKADLESLLVNAKIKVNVKSGTIESITISKTAEGATINLSKDVKVLLVTINGKVSFTGTGIIVSASINVSGVTFEQKPQKQNLADGVEAPKITPPSSGGGSSGGGNSGGNDEEVELDKDALQAAITTASALTSTDYTVESWTNLETALDLPETTQAEVDAKTAAIIAAMEGLVEVNEEELDKAVLEAAKTAATALTSTNYTVESWENLETALDLPETTQADVDAKTAAIIAAMEGLVEVNEEELDKVALEAAKTTASALTATDYTVESWANLTTALDLPETTQAEVDAKTAAIIAAIEGLVEVKEEELDKVALEAAKTTATALTAADYTVESWKNLTTALDLPETTQAEVDAKTAAIIAAIEGLELIEIPHNYALLNGLSIGEENLIPTFEADVTSYTAITSTTSSAITMTAITTTGTAISVTVTGTGITGTAISVTTSTAIGGVAHKANIPLATSGDTIVTLTVSAADLEDKIYTIKISKE